MRHNKTFNTPSPPNTFPSERVGGSPARSTHAETASPPCSDSSYQPGQYSPSTARALGNQEDLPGESHQYTGLCFTLSQPQQAPRAAEVTDHETLHRGYRPASPRSHPSGCTVTHAQGCKELVRVSLTGLSPTTAQGPHRLHRAPPSIKGFSNLWVICPPEAAREEGSHCPSLVGGYTGTCSNGLQGHGSTTTQIHQDHHPRPPINQNTEGQGPARDGAVLGDQPPSREASPHRIRRITPKPAAPLLGLSLQELEAGP